MCRQETCPSCRQLHWNRCSAARAAGLPGQHCPDRKIKNRRRSKCFTCEVIEGTINKLHTLVYQQPWRELGGREIQPWEEEETGSQQQQQQQCTPVADMYCDEKGA